MKKNSKKIKTNGGQAMLISVIFFLFISLSIITGLVSPTLREFRNSGDILKSRQSFFLSESGAEDAYYRIITNRTISSPLVLTLAGNTATTTITNILGGGRQIVSLGEVGNVERKVSMLAQTGAGVGFNYGLQAGTGGVTMSGSSSVVGNVYSNGPITGSGSSSVTGTAISASTENLPIISHTGVFPPTYSVDFGYENSAPEDVAQSFTVSETQSVRSVRLYVKRSTSGWMNNITLRISSGASNPSGTLSSVVIPYSSISIEYDYFTAQLPSNLTLNPGTTYWIVLDTSATWSARYSVGSALSGYAGGVLKTGTFGGTLVNTSPVGLDMYFDLYAPTSNGLITGLSIGANAEAYQVSTSAISGSLYCKIGFSNNKACNSSTTLAGPAPFPFTEENFQAWKDEAAAGGTITGSTNCPGGSSGGNCVINHAGATFGPGKINGNLTVGGGGTLTLTGPVWVVGNIDVGGGGKIILPASYANYSETLVTDGRIDLGGGSSTGSGVSNSYLFVASTSTCPTGAGCSGIPAINIDGGSGNVAAVAQEGTVRLGGGVNISAVTAKLIDISGGADVIYNAGLASPSFQSGPSGAWILSSWKESE